MRDCSSTSGVTVYYFIILLKSLLRNVLCQLGRVSLIHTLGNITSTEYTSKMESKDKKLTNFDGKGNVVEFVKKVSLHSALKGYDGEKKAQNLASRLSGPAFEVYLRMTDDDQKDDTKIEAELLKEFKRGKQDREEAIAELQNRRRRPDESTQTFAYNLMELVKLAYPSFTDDVRRTLAKDYFVKGVHPKMQIALKSIERFKDLTINDLATECVRLQLVGIQSYANVTSSELTSVNVVNNSTDSNASLVDTITESVIQRLQASNLCDVASSSVDDSDGGSDNVNNVYRGRGSARGNRFPRRNSSYPARRSGRGRQNDRKCRGCQSTGHIVKDCPTRFCQACGGRGHDAWQQSCPNHQ